MPRDPEFDKLLYGDQAPPGAQKPKSAAPTPSGTMPTGTTPAAPMPPGTQGPITRGLEAVHSFVGAHDPLADTEREMGRGVAKSLAGTATGIPRAANAALGLIDPSMRQSLGDLAEQVPGVKRMEEFAAEPSQSWGETAGWLGGSGAQLMAGPATLPGKFIAGQGFVRGAPTVAGRAGQAATNVAKGGAAGAMMNPEDPSAGAVTGAATAGLAPGLGALMGSRYGRYIANNAMRGTTAAAVTGLAAQLGMPAHWLWAVGVPELIRFYHSPLGSKLGAFGEQAATRAAGALERAAPAAVGATTGGAEGEAERKLRPPRRQ